MAEHIIIQMETKAVSATGEFEGYGSVFGNTDLGGDVVVKGAFAESLKTYAAKGSMPAMLWAHDPTNPVGEWLAMEEDDRGLKVKGQLWCAGCGMDRKPVPDADRARNLMMANGPKGLSIGFNIAKEGASIEEIDGEIVRVIRKADLWEVSPVVFAMNPEAAVTVAKSVDIRSLEKAVRDRFNLSQKEAKAFCASLSGHRDGGDDDRDGSVLEEMAEILKTQTNQLHSITKEIAS